MKPADSESQSSVTGSEDTPSLEQKMSPFLLNVWRENGAYLRFADTKNSAIAAISIGLLILYFNQIFGVQISEWKTVTAENWALLTWQAYVGLTMLLLAGAVAALSIIPTLSKKSLRTQICLWIGAATGLVKSEKEDAACVYFVDIARYPTQEAFLQRLKRHHSIDMVSQNSEVAGQLWIVARIATAKYAQHAVSMWLLIVGTLLCSIA